MRETRDVWLRAQGSRRPGPDRYLMLDTENPLGVDAKEGVLRVVQATHAVQQRRQRVLPPLIRVALHVDERVVVRVQLQIAVAVGPLRGELQRRRLGRHRDRSLVRARDVAELSDHLSQVFGPQDRAEDFLALAERGRECGQLHGVLRVRVRRDLAGGQHALLLQRHSEDGRVHEVGHAHGRLVKTGEAEDLQTLDHALQVHREAPAALPAAEGVEQVFPKHAIRLRVLRLAKHHEAQSFFGHFADHVLLLLGRPRQAREHRVQELGVVQPVPLQSKRRCGFSSQRSGDFVL
eukprot:scaffold8303_cov277-Pinguiococcus_pyrenoidosus.AAC.6